MKRFYKIILSALILTFTFLSVGLQTSAASYYASVDTTNGTTLINSLSTIISSNTVNVGYDNLWDAYKTTDVKSNGKIWDMYSSCEYTPVTDQGSSATAEGSGYNREHSVPQSWFSEASTPKADLFHVYPTDVYVNNKRSSYVYGEVKTATFTSSNGCKLGTSSNSKFSGTVFEPADEYKGDFARTYFYMATRYKDSLSSWTSGESTKIFKSTYPYLTDYALELFTKWSHQDPVSTKEKNRNEAVYKLQKNRNPFIEYPEYIDIIWENEYTVKADTEKINNVINLIKNLPATITIDSKNQVLAAEAAYNALNSEEKKLVTNYSSLTLAISSLNDLLSEMTEDVSYVGFESSEGFTATSVYNNQTEAESGNENQTWMTYYGTPTTSDVITGSQSMQLRWYTSATSNIGYTYMNYNVGGVNSLTFKAKATNGLNLNVYYSTDLGSTWTGKKTITLSTSANTYTYGVSAAGLANVRFRFEIALPETAPTATSRVTIDDVTFISEGVPESVTAFKSQKTMSSLKMNYSVTKQDSTKSAGYYLATSASDIKAGSKIIIVNNNASVALSTTQNTGNRGSSSVTINNSFIETISEDVQVITVEAGTLDNTFAFNVGDKYLYASGNNSNNYLKTGTQKQATSSFTISITDGLATIIGQGDNTNKYIKYNKSSKIFSGYSETSAMELVSIYVYDDGINNTYTFDETYIRFGQCIEKELYENLLSLGKTVKFGVALSKDGINYTEYECEPAYVSESGASTVDPNGKYVQYAVVIKTPKANRSDLVYAKCYVEIDGVKYYMNESVYSVRTITQYYLANVDSLSDTEIEALHSLLEVC